MNKLLKKKIEGKKTIVGVVGLGYVGLPLAVDVANSNYKTIGFDILQRRVDKVNSKTNYVSDVKQEKLDNVIENKFLEATTDYSLIKKCDIICIAVPTPLDEYKQPDSIYVETSTKDIAKYLKKDTIIILESTTYPGTTEQEVLPILENNGLKVGKDIYLAYSPERVDPGNKKYKTNNTPKVVGGVTRECTQLSKLFYENILEAEVYTVSSPKVAEMEKIFENTFRNINIGLVNEMAILCNKMGIDVWEVIDAASTKPYGFMSFYPGPGIGGHCIPIDPFYLTWKAREYDYHTRLIELSGEINNYMPEYVLDRVMRMLNKQSIALNGAKVLILGVAYKKDIDDLRESPALKIIELFEENGADIYYNDPFIDSFEFNNKEYNSVEIENFEKYDITVIITNHSQYNYKEIVQNSNAVFDTRNATKDIVSEKIEKL